MSEEQFKAFMGELAEVMTSSSLYPADRSMYLAMRAWLHAKLVKTDGDS